MLQHNCKSAGRSPASASALLLSGRDLTLDDVHAISRRKCVIQITDDPDVWQRMRKAEELVQQAVAEKAKVYGVTTGFGSMAAVPVSPELAATSQANLLSFLNTGAGKPIDARHVRAAMALRANVLLRGASGVRREIVERFVKFLNEDAIPIVLDLGSIGASGDLVPLATIARAIVGHESPGRVMLGGHPVDGATALAELGLAPLSLRPKEAWPWSMAPLFPRRSRLIASARHGIS